jgi:lysozyme
MNKKKINHKIMKTTFLVFSIIGILGLTTKNLLDVTLSSNSDFKVVGIDLSHHNKVQNWNKVEKNISFCFIKATEGSNFKDPKFRSYWNECKKRNIPCGAYHFFKPGVPAVKQFNNFKKTVSLGKGDLPPVLDVELKECDMDEVNKWLKLAESYYGVKPIIYSDYFFYKILMERKMDSDYPLWLYLNKNCKLRPSFNNADFIFWQYDQRGKLEGIAGDVDFNTFISDSKKLESILIN